MLKPLTNEGFKRLGFEQGEGALREEAAFVIDAVCGGQAGVPVTTRALMHAHSATPGGAAGVAGGRCSGAPTGGRAATGGGCGGRAAGSAQPLVRGAIQAFVPSEGSSEEFGMPRKVEDADRFLSVERVQAIACLDLRCFNTDRHEGNLLVAKEPFSKNWFQRRLLGAAGTCRVGAVPPGWRVVGREDEISLFVVLVWPVHVLLLVRFAHAGFGFVSCCSKGVSVSGLRVSWSVRLRTVDGH